METGKEISSHFESTSKVGYALACAAVAGYVMCGIAALAAFVSLDSGDQMLGIGLIAASVSGVIGSLLLHGIAKVVQYLNIIARKP
ncbi:MAG: hypothetical protein GDA53_08695 [Rhodobacteraceae bacterium]|nr:hypothetical protein [Paracoccaceae bacterium]